VIRRAFDAVAGWPGVILIAFTAPITILAVIYMRHWYDQVFFVLLAAAMTSSAIDRWKERRAARDERERARQLVVKLMVSGHAPTRDELLVVLRGLS